ncbi:MAG: hypothetical protein IT270_00410 [Saprospiraceae bacterium]|nr:hypothetical protein [Saprospiraceae bacterium]
MKCIVFLLLLPFGVSAQVQFGELYTLEKNEFIIEFLEGRNGQLMLLKTVEGKKNSLPDWRLETYDDKLKKTLTAPMDAPIWNGEAADFLQLFQKKDKSVVLFWYAFEKSKNKHQILWSALDEKGSIVPLKLATEFEGDEKDDATFAFLLSEDNSKWLIRKRAPNKKTSSDELTVSVLDAVFNPLWKSKIEYPYASDKTVIESFDVDNSGHLLYILSSDTNVKSKTQESVRQEVLVYEGSPKPARSIVLNGNGQILVDPNVVVFKDKVMVVGSYCNIASKKDYFSNTSVGRMGAFHTIIEPATGKAGNIAYTPFSEATYAYFQVKEKDVNKGIYGVRLESILPDDDGGMWLVFQEGSATSYEGGNKWHTMYEAGPLLVYNYDNTGKFQKETFVHKAINASDDASGVGYIVLSEQQSLHFIYNNASKNWGANVKKHTDLWFGHTPQSTYKGTNKDTDVVYSRLSPDGKVKSEKLSGATKDALFLNYLSVVQPGNGTAVFITGRDEKYRLSRLTFAK